MHAHVVQINAICETDSIGVEIRNRKSLATLIFIIVKIEIRAEFLT